MGLFNLTTSLQTIFVLQGLHGAIFALGTTVMAALAVVVLTCFSQREGINMFAVFSNIAMVLGPAVGLYALQAYGSSALYMFSDYNDCACFCFKQCHSIAKRVS